MTNPSGRQIKGSVIIDYVKMIKASPDVPWSDHLLPEDLELARAMVLPGSWYPIEFFQRVGLAVFKLVAKENPALLRAYGASLADQLDRNHPGMVAKGKPLDTLRRYIQIQKSFYSFRAFDIEQPSAEVIVVHVFSTPQEVGIPVYIEQISAMVERLIVLSGRPHPKITVSTAKDAAEIKTSLHVSW